MSTNDAAKRQQQLRINLAKSKPLSVGELQSFVTNKSRLAFEMQILQVLHSHDVYAEHGGSYVDPVQKKSREFDIRAHFQRPSRGRGLFPRRLELAIECKQVGANSPILISRIPRRPSESFHCHIDSLWNGGTGFHNRQSVIRNESRILYRIGEPVGKQVDHLKRKGDLPLHGDLDSDNAELEFELSSDDGEVHEKWSQALSSTHELVEFAWRGCNKKPKEAGLVAFMPILVVPDGTLWKVDFSDDGGQLGEIEKVDALDFFVGRKYTGIANDKFVVSHIKFLTKTGLNCFLESLQDDSDSGLESDIWEQLFPE